MFGERRAAGLTLQVYNDASPGATAASNCARRAPGLFDPTPSRVLFNGILGLKGARNDNQRYAACDGEVCTQMGLAPVDQVPNPMLALLEDNNGYIIQMPPITADGATVVGGALVLGLNTRPNNQLAQDGRSPAPLLLDGKFGVALQIGGAVHEALIDSGTSVYALPSQTDQGVPRCGGALPLWGAAPRSKQRCRCA